MCAVFNFDSYPSQAIPNKVLQVYMYIVDAMINEHLNSGCN